MLKSLDVLIGLIVVLLALSMAVTIITQTITTIVNSRGRHLRRGLTDLLQQLDPALTPALSKAVATHVLTHPLVSGSSTPFAWLNRLTGSARLGNVVHREEFTKLLMGLACEDGTAGMEATAREALSKALANNGVTDPAALLKQIRSVALQLERSAPELSHGMRQNMAILASAQTDLVAKINNWFDQTMDRTSQRFTASTRVITFAGAFIVAFGLQVDTPALVNRLAADDALRAEFLRRAESLPRDLQEQEREAAASQPTSTDAADGAANAANDQAEPAAPASGGSTPADAADVGRRYRAFLAETGLIRLPSSAGWWDSFHDANIFGMLITALLLSMGAPFWYSALGRLLQLRSALAVKDDVQRQARQTRTGRAGDAAARADVAPADDDAARAG